jgi:asparagine synthase (glutamine-hydrolysing)
MCGICGVVAPGKPPELDIVEAMASLLSHRGPDGDGSYAGEGAALGFRRLAIIDLSDAGMQPFASEDGRLQLIHNGEIYNYRELRGELESRGHRFRSATDTEVVLAAYSEWGDRCVERFVGMWAFAIWDQRAQRLFASRDRFGIKPFYYRLGEGRLVFASEPKAFLADRATDLDVNLAAVREYLEQSYLDHMEETFFADIRRLPPAHSLSYGSKGLEVKCYWRLSRQDLSTADPAEAIREQFLDSIKLHLRSDVPIGSCLSGGIDSSAIVTAVDYLRRGASSEALAIGMRQRTFTAFFDEPGYDERPFAEAVVRRTKADAHWITFDSDQLVADLPVIIAAQDEPFGSTSMVAQWYVLRSAADAGLKVILDGQGGDEVFAGYRAFIGFHLADLLSQRRFRELRRELAAFHEVHTITTLMIALGRAIAPEALTRFVRGRSRRSHGLVHRDLRGQPYEPARESIFPDRLRREQETVLLSRGLPELLRYEDRNSMAHSLEARVPFLDHRLVELAFSLPGDALIRSGRTKAVLRQALHDLLPPIVRERRDKLGFVTPEGHWLRGSLGELAADVFASRPFVERGFVDARTAQRRLARHRSGEIQAGMELWRALNLELWAQTYLDRQPR